jgi:transposase
MIGLTNRHTYFIYDGVCDMRKGFDGLSGLVNSEMGQDPLNGSVYIFVNRRRDRMKMLVWEAGGFMLYYKRLESGTFELPKDDSGTNLSIEWETLVYIIQGLRLDKIVKNKRYKRA